jgi:thiopurine S-methyltransferase
MTDWTQRWREGRIGFHEGEPNRHLVKYASRLHGRVLVPLCGKAVDLTHLVELGHDVVGVELAEQAVRAYFDERRLTPTVERRGPFTVFTGGGVTVLAGDVFATTPELVGRVDSIYDRAALIALPPETRARYVRQLQSLAPGAPAFLITLVYDQSRMEGPPFSVPEAEVRALYADVELLERTQAKSGGKCADSGVQADEYCYVVRLGQ